MTSAWKESIALLFLLYSKMNRNTKIFIIVAIPVVIVLIGVVVIIALCLNTCPDGKYCVALNSKNESTSEKVYEAGLHVISPAYHFSEGLPAENFSFVGGVQTQNEHILTPNEQYTELSVFVVFKFYVKKENVMEFFRIMPNNFSADEYVVSSEVARNATNVVTDVLGLWTCADYKNHDEQYFIDAYAVELKKRFEAAGMLFTLDETHPVKAVFLFDGYGCGIE